MDVSTQYHPRNPVRQKEINFETLQMFEIVVLEIKSGLEIGPGFGK